MKRIFLGLGSNVGDKKTNIFNAIKLLNQHIKELSVGRIYISKAVGFEKQEDFFNTAVAGYTDLSPSQLLRFVKEVEKKVGRIYRFHWGPREIDIDILFFDSLKVKEKNLEIPHPRAHERDFVLLPVMDIDKEFVHPTLNKTVEELYKGLKERSVYGCLI